MDKENVLLCISYDGSKFCGYQKQVQDRTVQGVLENAISKLLSEKIVSYSAGRTDSGVHAERQYVNFERTVGTDSSNSIPTERIFMALNSMLDKDIRVHWSRVIDEDFHARYSATHRAYYYQVYEGQVLPAFLKNYCVAVRKGLDWDMILRDLREFLGEHDFTAVSSNNEQIENPIRTIYKVDIIREGNIVKIYIEANAFLWKMVRTIVGTVLERAEYRYKGNNTQINKMASIKEILQSKDRSLAGATVVSWGLFLYDVQYKEGYGINTRII